MSVLELDMHSFQFWNSHKFYGSICIKI